MGKRVTTQKIDTICNPQITWEENNSELVKRIGRKKTYKYSLDGTGVSSESNTIIEKRKVQRKNFV